MIVGQVIYEDSQWKANHDSSLSELKNKLIFLFGERLVIEDNRQAIEELSELYPYATIVVVSASGSITDDAQVSDSLVATLVHLENSSYSAELFSIGDYTDASDLGRGVFDKLNQKEDLRHIIAFTVGHDFNGSDFVKGLNANKPHTISISGGLAGDGNRFEKTIIGLNNELGNHEVVAIGLYGNNLSVSTNSRSGWQPFGLTRTITKSNKNKIYEIDGKGALEMYKEYLGEYADGLPGMALFFPLQMQRTSGQIPLVRTILSIDEEDQSMTFAGDMPQGSKIRLMRGIKDEIILAAGNAIEDSHVTNTDLTMLISCVGRRITLGPRTEEELEEIRHRMGDQDLMFGYYSYGEISQNQLKNCELYNQTMTITTISER